MNTLTARQEAILAAIRDSVVVRGYPPSIRELGDKVGLASTSSVAHQLDVLVEKGYIRRDRGARALVLLDPRAAVEVGRKPR